MTKGKRKKKKPRLNICSRTPSLSFQVLGTSIARKRMMKTPNPQKLFFNSPSSHAITGESAYNLATPQKRDIFTCRFACQRRPPWPCLRALECHFAPSSHCVGRIPFALSHCFLVLRVARARSGYICWRRLLKKREQRRQFLCVLTNG